MATSINHRRYKKNIVYRLGGSYQYEKLIIEFCEQLVKEPTLKGIFGCVHADSLCKLQREVLDLALVEMVPGERERICTQVILYHYRIFSMGLKSTHFPFIKEVLLRALRHTWAEQDIIDDVLEYFQELEYVFFHGNDTSSNFVMELDNENERHVQQVAKWVSRVSTHVHT